MTNKHALLKNMGIMMSTVESLQNRETHLPGIGAFYGPSGFGKSHSAAFAAAQYNAYYVQAQSSWTKKALLLAIAKEMGLDPKKVIYELVAQVSEQLVLSSKLLIIDEMDYIVDKNYVDIVRDIYEASQGAILLIGEENLPNKLKRWERFHGRVMDWVPAQPADLEDAAELRELHCTTVKVADDLLAEICTLAKGSVRRICVNLSKVQSFCAANNIHEIDLDGWQTLGQELFTGEAPKRKL